MSVYENIMRGLTEAVEYRQGTLDVRETTLTAKGGDIVTLESPHLNQYHSDETTITTLLRAQHI
jgi:hypothetical protein